MKAIVTGANGFVGSSLIKKLVQQKFEVLAIDISFKNSKLPKCGSIIEKELSIEKIDELQNEIKTGEYELFYHFAWLGVNGPDKGNVNIQLSNIEMSLSCARAAKLFGCKKFLCAGTIAERNVDSLSHMDTISPGMVYGAAKHAANLLLEVYCKTAGIDFVWMQFSNIYGPTNRTGNLISYTLERLKNGEAALFGPARQPYDFIFVDDLIEAVYRIGIKNTTKHFYFIGSGTPMILSDYLNILGKLFGEPKLIKIGAREDDGVCYSFSMLDNSDLVNDIGNYISGSFEELIRVTIKGF